MPVRFEPARASGSQHLSDGTTQAVKIEQLAQGNPSSPRASTSPASVGGGVLVKGERAAGGSAGGSARSDGSISNAKRPGPHSQASTDASPSPPSALPRAAAAPAPGAAAPAPEQAPPASAGAIAAAARAVVRRPAKRGRPRLPEPPALTDPNATPEEVEAAQALAKRRKQNRLSATKSRSRARREADLANEKVRELMESNRKLSQAYLELLANFEATKAALAASRLTPNHGGLLLPQQHPMMVSPPLQVPGASQSIPMQLPMALMQPSSPPLPFALKQQLLRLQHQASLRRQGL